MIDVNYNIPKRYCNTFADIVMSKKSKLNMSYLDKRFVPLKDTLDLVLYRWQFSIKSQFRETKSFRFFSQKTETFTFYIISGFLFLHLRHTDKH